MSSQPNPHDAVFRRILGEPANAASQLKAVLPSVLVRRMDLDRLARAPGSFVDQSLRWRHSDLLFTAPLDGAEAFVYILIEHQSSTDPIMPFRMLRYVVRIWEQHFEDHPGQARLPAIIPLVVHHNRRPWSGPTQLLEMIHLDFDSDSTIQQLETERIAELLPQFRVLLDDLAVVDEDTLRARPVTPVARIALLLLKFAAANERLGEDLRRWSDDLRAVLDRPNGFDDFIALVTYIESVGETPADELQDVFAQLGPEAEEAYVTTAEALRAEGRAEGEARGRTEALLQLLTLKFGPLPQTALDTVQAGSTAQVETWTARVLTAGTLDDVLR